MYFICGRVCVVYLFGSVFLPYLLWDDIEIEPNKAVVYAHK